MSGLRSTWLVGGTTGIAVVYASIHARLAWPLHAVDETNRPIRRHFLGVWSATCPACAARDWRRDVRPGRRLRQ